jgi:hypothetical protein
LAAAAGLPAAATNKIKILQFAVQYNSNPAASRSGAKIRFLKS